MVVITGIIPLNFSLTEIGSPHQVSIDSITLKESPMPDFVIPQVNLNDLSDLSVQLENSYCV